MIFRLRLEQEKDHEYDRELYVSVDLAKVFDMISHAASWKVLAQIGVPQQMFKVAIISLYRDTKAQVLLNDDQSE